MSLVTLQQKIIVKVFFVCLCCFVFMREYGDMGLLPGGSEAHMPLPVSFPTFSLSSLALPQAQNRYVIYV